MDSGYKLGRIYDEHASAVAAYLMNLTRNEADTRDLLQEVFVRLAKRPELLDDILSPRSFLLHLAHNLAMDRLRRLAVRERYAVQVRQQAEPLFAPADDPDTDAFRHALATALAGLPVEQRSVVHLKLWEGLTFEVIAQLLEIPPNTAASRYRYALDKMRTQLRPLYEEIR